MEVYLFFVTGAPRTRAAVASMLRGGSILGVTAIACLFHSVSNSGEYTGYEDFLIDY